MKYVYIVILIILMTMTGCTKNDGNHFNSISYENNQQYTNKFQVAGESESIDEPVEESIFEIIIPYFIVIENRIYMYDLKNWSLVLTYTIDNYDVVNEPKILENGYFLVSARNYTPNELAWKEWWASNDEWPEEDDYGFVDFTLLEEYDDYLMTSYLVFNESFNYIDSFLFENNFSVVLSRYNNGELIFYVNRVDLTNPANRILNYYRINLSSGKIDELFQLHGDIQILGYADENHFLGVSSNFYFGDQIGQETPLLFRETSFGLICAETGEKNFFTVENFGYRYTIIAGSLLLLSEMNMSNLEQTNRVIIFNMETNSYDIIQLLPNDSHIARLSLDKNHIVTINLAENLFRRYDMTGKILFETSIEMEFEMIFGEVFPFGRVQLFVIDEHIYSIHYISQEGYRQVEFIRVEY